jgi:hypothetical protein
MYTVLVSGHNLKMNYLNGTPKKSFTVTIQILGCPGFEWLISGHNLRPVIKWL